MIKTKIALIYFSALSAIFISIPKNIYPYVCGYSRLISPNGKQRVDLIYDFHKPFNTNYNNNAWIDNCHKNERVVYNHLKKLNKNAPYNIDLIWESNHNTCQRSGLFISHAPSLKNELSNKIKLVDSDIERNKFERRMINRKKRQKFLNNITQPVTSFFNNTFKQSSIQTNHQDPNEIFYNYQRYNRNMQTGNLTSCKKGLGCTAIPQVEIISNITKNFGKSVVQHFKSLFTGNRNKLKKLVPYSGQIEIEYLLDNQTFHDIADIEMLGNVLASDKKKVIVYAGCFHCLALKNELINLGYKLIKSSEQNYNTDQPKQLKSKRLVTFLA